MYNVVGFCIGVLAAIWYSVHILTNNCHIAHTNISVEIHVWKLD